jgi:type II secretory pathway component PulK
MVLVTVLWIAVILTILVASVGRTHRVDTKISFFTGQQRRCAWAARGGVETALAMLEEDDPSSDSLDELWSDNDEDYNDVPVGACTLTIRVIDEAGKLNVNTASRAQLLGLPEMEEEIADAILDWRDQDEDPKAEGVEGGYYEQLPYPYRIRNGALRTVRELLLVKGVEEYLFYGEDTNHNGILDENEQDGAESLPDDDGDDELDRGWIDLLTCYSYEYNRDAQGTQRVNISSANQRQLERDLGLQPSHARWIVENRGNNGYQSIGDLINNQTPKTASGGGSGNQAQRLDLSTYQNIVDRITVSDEDIIPGRVNLNTAPREVLVALFGGEGEGEELAENVMAYRAGFAYGMSSVGSLLNVSGVNVSDFKKVADQVSVRSPVYSIRCVARASQTAVSGATAHQHVVVDRSKDPPEYLYRYQGVGTK